eukprot:COSAG05_NODE_1186_length_5587_cov_26.631560_2_plen_151_part_00
MPNSCVSDRVSHYSRFVHSTTGPPTHFWCNTCRGATCVTPAAGSASQSNSAVALAFSSPTRAVLVVPNKDRSNCRWDGLAQLLAPLFCPFAARPQILSPLTASACVVSFAILRRSLAAGAFASCLSCRCLCAGSHGRMGSFLGWVAGTLV